MEARRFTPNGHSNRTDRWGEQIFYSNNPDIKWNGAAKGKPLPPAVFVYHATFEYPDGDVKKQKGSLR